MLSNLEVRPQTAGPGETVRVTVEVRNFEGVAEPYAATLRVAAAIEETRTGTLGPGEARVLLFQVRRDVPGTYSITVDGLVSDFTVVAPVEVELPTEVTITAATTVAVDEGGNTLSLTGDTVASKVVEGELLIEIPVALAEGKGLDTFSDATSGVTVRDNVIEIPVRDVEGNVQMKLVAETDGFVGTGTTVVAKVTKLTLVTEEQEVDLSKDDPTLGRMAFTVEADLKALPKGARLTLTPKKALPLHATAGFELLARNEGLTIADVGAVLEIERENLENVTQVGTVTIRMKVGRAWVEAHGGNKRIRMCHLADEGTREWLETGYVGDDAQGRMIFEAVSPKGFSLFALLALAPRPPAFETSQLTVRPSVVEPDEVVEVSALVTNKGKARGTYNVILSVNGEPEGSQAVTLDAGANTTVTFYVLRTTEGTYTVQIEELTGTFEVRVTLPPRGLPPWAIALIVIGGVGVLGVIGYFVRRTTFFTQRAQPWLRRVSSWLRLGLVWSYIQRAYRWLRIDRLWPYVLRAYRWLAKLRPLLARAWFWLKETWQRAFGRVTWPSWLKMHRIRSYIKDVYGRLSRAISSLFRRP